MNKSVTQIICIFSEKLYSEVIYEQWISWHHQTWRSNWQRDNK